MGKDYAFLNKHSNIDWNVIQWQHSFWIYTCGIVGLFRYFKIVPHSLHSWRWPQILIFLPPPPYLWFCRYMPPHLVLRSAGDWTQGLIYSRQMLYQLSYIQALRIELKVETQYYNYTFKARRILLKCESNSGVCNEGMEKQCIYIILSHPKIQLWGWVLWHRYIVITLKR